MIFFILGWIWIISETAYFGWNWVSVSPVESACDIIGITLVVFGIAQIKRKQ